MANLKYLFVFVFIFTCNSSCREKTEKSPQFVQNQKSTNKLEQDLDKLLNWFPGEYDNHQQVYKEAVDSFPIEKRHRQTHHIFFPVELNFIEGREIYAQQSQHYDLNNIYRQRIYAFQIDSIEQAIRLTIYTPKEPKKLKDAHLNPVLFEGLTIDDFFLKPGCDVYWKRNGEQFEGYLQENACSYFSKRFNTEVFLNETLILRKDALLLDDTAVDSSGNLVFGVNDKGPTINLKEIPCTE